MMGGDGWGRGGTMGVGTANGWLAARLGRGRRPKVLVRGVEWMGM
jgi:hypothetical protein